MGTPGCSRPQPATDNGVRDGRSNWLVAPPPSWAVPPGLHVLHGVNEAHKSQDLLHQQGLERASMGMPYQRTTCADTHGKKTLYSCNTAVHQYCSTPILQYTNTAVHQYCSTPILQYTNTAVHQYCSTPILQYTNTAVHQYCSTPILQCTNTAVHQYCSTTTLQYTNTAIHTYTVHKACCLRLISMCKIKYVVIFYPQLWKMRIAATGTLTCWSIANIDCSTWWDKPHCLFPCSQAQWICQLNTPG